MRGICMRCGFRRTDLRREWTALLVCGPCFDSKPAEMSPPRLNPNEGAPNREVAPEPEDYEVEVNEVGPDDL